MKIFGHSKWDICRNRLLRRRRVVVRTRAYLDATRFSIAATPPGEPHAAQRSRRRFVDEIYGWYDQELKKIDQVLKCHPNRRFS